MGILGNANAVVFCEFAADLFGSAFGIAYDLYGRFCGGTLAHATAKHPAAENRVCGQYDRNLDGPVHDVEFRNRISNDNRIWHRLYRSLLTYRIGTL